LLYSGDFINRGITNIEMPQLDVFSGAFAAEPFTASPQSLPRPVICGAAPSVTPLQRRLRARSVVAKSRTEPDVFLVARQQHSEKSRHRRRLLATCRPLRHWHRIMRTALLKVETSKLVRCAKCEYASCTGLQFFSLRP
jgi:hypothetical protein